MSIWKSSPHAAEVSDEWLASGGAGQCTWSARSRRARRSRTWLCDAGFSQLHEQTADRYWHLLIRRLFMILQPDRSNASRLPDESASSTSAALSASVDCGSRRMAGEAHHSPAPGVGALVCVRRFPAEVIVVAVRRGDCVAIRRSTVIIRQSPV
jgi:hypothetical protein